MAQRTGRRRKLTDEQIQHVLTWHAKWREFRARWGSQESLAQKLCVKRNLIYGCIARYHQSGGKSLFLTQYWPKQGRRRILAVGQARAIIAWHLRYRRFLARQGTLEELARSFSVSVRTLHDCIGGRGTYREFKKSYAPASDWARALPATSKTNNRVVYTALKGWKRRSS